MRAAVGGKSLGALNTREPQSLPLLVFRPDRMSAQQVASDTRQHYHQPPREKKARTAVNKLRQTR